MTSLKWVWFGANVAEIIASNISYSFIINYIGSKPLGHQSIYDLVVRDHVRLARITGSDLFANRIPD